MKEAGLIKQITKNLVYGGIGYFTIKIMVRLLFTGIKNDQLRIKLMELGLTKDEIKTMNQLRDYLNARPQNDISPYSTNITYGITTILACRWTKTIKDNISKRFLNRLYVWRFQGKQKYFETLDVEVKILHLLRTDQLMKFSRIFDFDHIIFYHSLITLEEVLKKSPYQNEGMSNIIRLYLRSPSTIRLGKKDNTTEALINEDFEDILELRNQALEFCLEDNNIENILFKDYLPLSTLKLNIFISDFIYRYSGGLIYSSVVDEMESRGIYQEIHERTYDKELELEVLEKITELMKNLQSEYKGGFLAIS